MQSIELDDNWMIIEIDSGMEIGNGPAWHLLVHNPCADSMTDEIIKNGGGFNLVPLGEENFAMCRYCDTQVPQEVYDLALFHGHAFILSWT